MRIAVLIVYIISRCWITYALRRETANISEAAFRWTPQGKMKRGRSRSIWRWIEDNDDDDDSEIPLNS